MFDTCPGVSRLKTPTLEIKICPVCGSEIELFSTDIAVTCEKCGFVAYNDMQSCISWCKHAKQCIGEELYNKLVSANPNKNENDSPENHESD
jgi:NADH pyrophosphatase NudC (nudix superfamily)